MKDDSKEMLITANITINVTNDGVKNEQFVEVSDGTTMLEVLTVLDMSNSAMKQIVEKYITSKKKNITEEQLKKILNMKFNSLLKAYNKL